MALMHLASILIVASHVLCARAARLVPSRGSPSLDIRDTSIQEFTPKGTVTLNYALAWHRPPTAIVSFVAYPGRPILLLEELIDVLEDVTCAKLSYDSTDVIVNVRFTTDNALIKAHNLWTTLDEFGHALIYAYQGWLNKYYASVVSVTAGAEALTLALLSSPITMREVGRSFRVRYGHSGTSEWTAQQEFEKRGMSTFDEVYNFGYNPDVPSRLALFPPNASVDGGVSDAIIRQLTDADIQLTCIGCTMKSNVTIGMDFEVDLGDAACAITPNDACVSLSRADMNLTIGELEQTAALEVYIGKPLSAGANYKLLWVPAGPALNIPSLVNLGPAVGLEIAFELDISSSINFTLGATGQVPSGAFAQVSLLNSTGDWGPSATASGWGGTGVEQIPFRVNDGQFNITTSIAFAPYAEIAFTILDIGAALRLVQNVPKVLTSAFLRTSVNRECNPIGDNDFESFGQAFLVGAGMEMSTVASLILEKGKFIGHGIPDTWDLSVWSHDIALLPTLGTNKSSCFVLTDDSGDSGLHSGKKKRDNPLPGVPATTGTLFSAASAVPTWDITKIESYYKANGHLPSNVNYTQMAEATTVPDVIKAAVQTVASQQGTASPPFKVLFGSAGVLIPIIIVHVAGLL